MTSIGPTRLLLAEIRAQAIAWRRRTQAQPHASVPEEHPPAGPGAQREASVTVATAVLAIDPDDPQRHRKAFRAFLQVVLARECGIRLVDEPGFQALVDQVQQSMELDPRLREAMTTAGRMLLESAEM